ncbi:TldD/PmbA family protein [Hoyosella sp. G463]|uniref:TldD/PmbA family protein n=1 Tax=Lolliginicoccus lacisalsi TaxID=2742202 RepID=A0A927JCR8_9ACTN|nr:metallopeptidase TldD-related protein [Lolliginicoccus lacisalsi]MBD8506834.1 TldD/PmbA family protein [Lolliginicoccus lacisalsi]
MIAAQELIEQVLAVSVADDVAVIVADVSEASLRWANSSMTTNGSSVYREWSVVSFFAVDGGVSVGVVDSASVDAGDIADVVRASEETARAAAPTAEAMPLVAASDPDGDWSEPASTTSIEVFAGLVAPLAAAFDGPDRLFGFAHHVVRTTWLGTSAGMRRRWVQHTGSIEINGKRDHGTHVASAWAGTGTTDFGDVDASALLRELDRRLGWSRSRVELPAGRYEVILPSSATADLMIPLLWSLSGRSAHEGRSAFSRPGGGTRVGERIATLPLALRTDPRAEGIEAIPFVATSSSSEDVSVFDNGLPIEAVDWIADGKLAALPYSRAGAAEHDASPAHAAHNLELAGGSESTIEEMVRATKRGLLLTCLWYIREVDPATVLLTGLTRDGVYLIEDGEIVGEVNNFRFNESPLSLLERANEAGASERTLPREWADWFTRAIMPPLRVPDFHMSSVSQAT